MTEEVNSKQLRSFGLIVGGVFLLIACWPLILRSENPRLWAAAVSAALVIPAIVYPASLKQVHRGWMALGHVLGWINTRIILGFIFFGLVTPIGVVRRWMGKDPMGRRPDRNGNSYRVIRSPRAPAHLMKQY
jgi:hypothetical protein